MSFNLFIKSMFTEFKVISLRINYNQIFIYILIIIFI